MNLKAFILAVLALVALIVYLFVSAPPPLPEQAEASRRIPIATVFAIAETENDAVRALWTADIVGKGKLVGLKFDEHWRDPDVQAGPLPALFLRETAKSLEKDPVRLSLFLGSDFPINPANRFQSVQMETVALIKQTRTPQFFFMSDTGLYTAMFPDVAIVKPCIECHNEHPDSPKKDWRLDDVMGATTWSYPEAVVSVDDALQIIAALRNGFRAAYSAYLAKVETFAQRPEIGAKWPRDGFFLPSADVFMTEVYARTSAETLNSFLAADAQPKPAADVSPKNGLCHETLAPVSGHPRSDSGFRPGAG